MDIPQIVAAMTASGALADAAARTGVEPAEAGTILTGILAHIDAGGRIAGVAGAVAANTGLDASRIEAFLPQVLPLIQGHAAAAPEAGRELMSAFINAAGAGGGARGHAWRPLQAGLRDRSRPHPPARPRRPPPLCASRLAA